MSATSTPAYYQRGRRARERGTPRELCPYAFGSTASIAWQAGWGHRDLELRVHVPAEGARVPAPREGEAA